MADPYWPTAPWHLLAAEGRGSASVSTSSSSIPTARPATSSAAAPSCWRTGLWFTARRRALAWLGVACLLAVIVQGVLGGFRVRLDALFGADLATVHGFFAQVVFSLLVCAAVLTAPPRAEVSLDDDYVRRCRHVTAVLATAALLQVTLGVLVRHTHGSTAQRLHVLTAFALVAAVVWFVRMVWEDPAGRRAFGRVAVVLPALIVLQVAARRRGVDAAIHRPAAGPELQPVTPGSALVRTLHVLAAPASWLRRSSPQCRRTVQPRRLPSAMSREQAGAASSS